MKTLGMMLASVAAPLRRRDARIFLWLLLALVVLVVGFAAVFHQLMALEGESYSWATGIYWVLVTMSTLGFGDIVFASEAGRIFSVIVLLTGASFILVVLPFAFLQFIFTPWMEAREAARAPREVPSDQSGHVVITALDAVTDAFIERLDAAEVPYVLIEPDVDEALRLHDAGYRVMRGDVDDPRTYERARVAQASLVATTRSDTANSNVAFTVRELTDDVPIVATATKPASVDVLELAGCDQVLQLGQLLGEAMARRVLGGDHATHRIGQFGPLSIAEASVAGTELTDRRLDELDLRRRCGTNVVGVWQRGRFERAAPDTRLCDQSILILAGTDAQLAAYDDAFGVEHPLDQPVLILGGGRVGRAAAASLAAQDVPSVIVEQRAERLRPDQATYVHGDAAELEVLREAGLDDATTVLITTHEDDVNVYLTLYVRKLRPELQIVARSILDRNVTTLHRAGADAVLSYASLGATALWNARGDERRLVIAEGLEVFEVPVPAKAAGRSLADSDLGAITGCNVIAVREDGQLTANPDPSSPLPHEGHLVVIGDEAAERCFLERFPVERD